MCEPTARKAQPRTTYEAQFSLPFSVAAALVHGRVGVDTYKSERLGDPEVLAVASRVRYAIDPDARFPASFPGWVRVRLTDGRIVETRAEAGPPTREAILQKFRANAAQALPASRIGELERRTLDLDRLPSLGVITALCRP